TCLKMARSSMCRLWLMGDLTVNGRCIILTEVSLYMIRRNSMRWLILCVLSILVAVAPAMAQETDMDKARMYVDLGDYDKAIDLYKDLYKADNRNTEIYNGYLDALMHEKRYKDAEQLVNGQIQRNPANAAWMVDMGRI